MSNNWVTGKRNYTDPEAFHPLHKKYWCSVTCRGTHTMLYYFNLYIWSRDLYCLNPPYTEVSVCCLKKKKNCEQAFPWMTWLWEMYTFQMTVHWLLLTQLRCIACIISPCTVFHLLQCHGFSASLLFRFEKRLLLFFPPFTSCLYCMEGAGRENTCLWLHVTTSCVFQSLPVTPHCFPFLPRSQPYLWEHLCINFPAGLQEPCKRQSGMMWFLKTGISLWCCSPLPALICGTLYSPMPDGRLKSIILPTENVLPWALH